MAIEEMIFAVGAFGVPALAVLWNYSALPKIDWKMLMAGALLYLTAGAIGVLAKDLAVFTAAATTTLVQIAAVIAIIGSILVIAGALQNAAGRMK